MKLALTLTLCLATTGAQAQFVDGHKLFSLMNGTTEDIRFAQGFVSGAADQMMGTEWCPSEGVTIQQAYDVTKTWVTNMPKNRDYAGIIFVQVALSKQWPCKVAP